MRAADALMKSLKAEGVDNVFGIPGGANLPTYDALVDADFRHVKTRHEQGAGQVVARIEFIRQGIDRRPELLDGFEGSALLAQHHPVIVAGVCPSGRFRDRAAEELGRLLETTCL